MSNPTILTHEKQTSAYLKRRARKLMKRAQFTENISSKDTLTRTAERILNRANELYFNA